MHERYQLEAEVGHGRYGRLYRAIDLQTGRRVACKRLADRWIAVPDFGMRWAELVQLLGRLNHPHIAPLLDTYHEGGQAWLISPWQEADPSSPPPPNWGDQAADALAYAHRQGMVHGGVQASNIFHTPQGPLLTDFALYRLDPEGVATGEQDLRTLAELIQKTATTPPPSPTVAETSFAPPSPPITPADSPLQMRLPQTDLRLAPHGRADWQLTLVNEGNLVTRLSMAVRGLPANWYTIGRDGVQLLPRSEQSLLLSFHPPAGATAGTYPLEIVAQDLAGGATHGAAVLTVEPIAQFAAQMHPQTVLNRGQCHVQLHNHGNTPTTLTVAGRDTAEVAHFNQPQTVELAANESQTVLVHVSADKRPWLGSMGYAPFTVHVTPSNGEPQVLAGQLNITPYLPAWLVPVASVLFLLVCVLGMFLGSRYVSRRLDLALTQEAVSIQLTAAVTPSPTAEPAPTLTRIPTLTPANTATPTPTPTLEPTATPTLEPTAVPTEEPTSTPELEEEPTVEPTETASPTPTPSPTVEGGEGEEEGEGGVEGEEEEKEEE